MGRLCGLEGMQCWEKDQLIEQGMAGKSLYTTTKRKGA